MGKRLLLLRHAEAGPHLHMGASDQARPLTAHGSLQAAAVGRALAGHDLPGALTIISSPARRTRETADLVRQALPGRASVIVENALYDADLATLYAVIHSVADTCPAVMIVGHNPGIGALARDLLGSQIGHDAFSPLEAGYAPATLTLFSAPEHWLDVRPSTVRGECLILP